MPTPPDIASKDSPVTDLTLLHWAQHDTAAGASLPVNTTGSKIAELIRSSSRLDILTGYFYLNGVSAIQEALAANPRITIRILVGMEAQVVTTGDKRQILETNLRSAATDRQAAKIYAETLRSILNSTPASEKTNTDRRLYKTFAQMLLDGRISIRQTRQPNHSKLYLFHKQKAGSTPHTYILGSSNFTKPGLEQRQELNITIGGHVATAATLYDLYQDLWRNASFRIAQVDPRRANAEAIAPPSVPDSPVIAEIQSSKAYADPTPFQAYMAIMKHYLGDSVADAKLDKQLRQIVSKAGYRPISYQILGAIKAISILRAYRGVIVADATGLGKSVTACLIASQSHSGGGVIIVPPHLKDDWITSYLTPFGLASDQRGQPWRVFKSTELDEARHYCAKQTISTVIVDEAHRFRNSKLKDYGALSAICHNRNVVLLTATPLNNYPSDLWALINLTPIGQRHLHGTGSPKILDYIDQLDKEYKDLIFYQRNINRLNPPKSVKTQLVRLTSTKGLITRLEITRKEEVSSHLARIGTELLTHLRPYILRRNRADLRDNSEYYDNGAPIPIPHQEVAARHYQLSAAQAAAFQGILDKFHYGDAAPDPTQHFTCAIYRAAEYAVTDESAGNYLDNYRAMTLRHLILRFESSPYAFQSSVIRLIERYRAALQTLEDPAKFCFDPTGTLPTIQLDDDDDDPDDPGSIPSTNLRLFCRPGSILPGTPFAKGRDTAFIQALKSDLAILSELEELSAPLVKDDQKLAALQGIIAEYDTLAATPAQLAQDNSSAQPRRLVVFTRFIDTACDIARKLAQAYGADKVMLAIDSTTTTSSSTSLGPLFDTSPAVRAVDNASQIETVFNAAADSLPDPFAGPRILVTTDKFSEGVNINRAGILVNYDIPWNPTRVIQRLGRISRISACPFERVFIHNLYPAQSGGDWATPRDVVAQKLILIHSIFFEDATILGDLQAATGSPFEKLDQAQRPESETASEETLVRNLYEQSLTVAGIHTAAQRQEFERAILAYGQGMRAVRLRQPRADMVIFRQRGALISAHYLDDLHTTDRDKRTTRIPTFYEALAKIRCSPSDNQSLGFTDAYEETALRMDRAKTSIFATKSTSGQKNLNRAKRLVDTWISSNSSITDLAKLYQALEERPSESLVKAITTRRKAPTQAFITNLLEKTVSPPPPEDYTDPSNVDYATLLTFVNDTTENCK